MPVEPVHEGRPLSYWVGCLYDNTNGPAGREALRAMGPQAAEYFFDSIDADPGDTLTREIYRSVRKSLPQTLRKRTPPPPIPQRTWLQDIAGYLGLIGAEAHESILRACAHRNPKVRSTAVQATPYLGRWRADAIPVVARLLSDPDPDVRQRAVAALALNQTGDKSAALPALLQAVQPSHPALAESSLATTAKILGEIGPEAIEAAPRLREYLLSTNALLRVESGIALWKINRDTNALNCLIAEIGNPNLDRDILWNFIPAVGAMGPAAQPLVPALERRLERLESAAATNSPGWLSTALHIALRRITVTNAPKPTVRPLAPSDRSVRP